jgi:ABC-type multidrug transport system fused ATPase/permease subunit
MTVDGGPGTAALETYAEPLQGLRAFLHVLRRFLPFLIPLWDKYLLRFLIFLVRTVNAVLALILMAKIVDEGMLAGDVGALFFWISIEVASRAVAIGTWCLSLFLEAYIVMRMSIGMKMLVHDHVQRLSLRFHKSRPVGEHMWRIQGDSQASLDLLCNLLPATLESVIQVVIAASLVLLLSPLSVLCIVVYIVLLVLYLHFGASYLRRLNLGLFEAIQRMTATLQENLSAFPTSKSLGRGRFDRLRYYKSLTHMLRCALRYAITNTGWLAGTQLGKWWNMALSYVLLCGLLVLRGDMTLGEYVALGMIIDWLTFPVQRFVRVVEQARVAAAPAERMLDTLELIPEIVSPPNAPSLQNVRGELTFENVSFRYTPDGPDVIRDLSFTVAPGKKVAIVGPSGAGKSTVFNLVMRYYDPTGGRVLIDGHDLREIDLASFREHTSIVLQETFVFSATLRDNILYGNLRATEAQLQDSVQRAGINEFLDELPEGLDTQMAEGGNLSGGQRQRIALARAFVRDPRFLFLDEATSALDPITERTLLKHLREVEQGRTRVVVAHSLETIVDADEILVLDGGTLVQRGTHDELAAMPGLYRRMWQSDSLLEEGNAGDVS